MSGRCGRKPNILRMGIRVALTLCFLHFSESMALTGEIKDLLARAGTQASSGCCQQRLVVGPCRASFPRWFYNDTADECQFFYYGGCWANCNNFQSEMDCEATCL